MKFPCNYFASTEMLLPVPRLSETSYKTALFCLCASAVVLRFVLAHFGVGNYLSEERVDVANCLNSYDGIADGQALRALGLSPYGGPLLHAPPLLYVLLAPLVRRHPVVQVLPSVVADVFSALSLVRLVRFSRKKLLPCHDMWSSASAALFLWSPWSVAACVGHEVIFFKRGNSHVNRRNWGAVETCTALAGAVLPHPLRTVIHVCSTCGGLGGSHVPDGVSPRIRISCVAVSDCIGKRARA